MKQANHSERTTHNRFQQGYYAGTPKTNMLPVGSPYLRRQVGRLLACTDLRPGNTVLEVGCGLGRYTLLLRQAGLDVTALDLSFHLLRALKNWPETGSRPNLVCADVHQLPFDGGRRFDAALTCFALHHVYNVEQSVRAMAAVVKPGGLLAFLEPNPLNPLYYVQMAVKPGMTWAGDRGIINMRARILLPILSRIGCRTIRHERFGFFPPFVTNTRAGEALEALMERLSPLKPYLPFQIFVGEVP